MELKKGTVSLIVPVYNVEKYLRRCLESIKNQTYTNLQIIMVNDGSVDNSGSICKEYADSDSRFIYIEQENKGVSGARNTALNHADGEYLCFIDADDEFTEYTVSERVKNIGKCDMIITQFSKIDEDGNIISNGSVETAAECSSQGAISFVIRVLEYGYQGNICSKLFKTEIIKKNNIRFDEDIYYNEDRLFIIRYLLCCSSVVIKPIVSYLYRIRNISAMGALMELKKNYNAKMLTEITAFERIIDILGKDRQYDNRAYCRKIMLDISMGWIRKIYNINKEDTNKMIKTVNKQLVLYVGDLFKVTSVKHKCIIIKGIAKSLVCYIRLLVKCLFAR